jgi:uncharacterized protein (TIGR03083 family)
MDTWQMIKAERVTLVDRLEKLSDADWDAPSLCTGWTVRDVVAHMIATAAMTPPTFSAKLIGSGLNFQAMTRKDIAQVRGDRTNADLVELMRGRIDARTAPPGPATSWLGETIVHSEDVFRALGGYGEHPVKHVAAVADFYKNSNLLIGAKNRIAGVCLKATDTHWRHGTGPRGQRPGPRAGAGHDRPHARPRRPDRRRRSHPPRTRLTPAGRAPRPKRGAAALAEVTPRALSLVMAEDKAQGRQVEPLAVEPVAPAALPVPQPSAAVVPSDAPVSPDRPRSRRCPRSRQWRRSSTSPRKTRGRSRSARRRPRCARPQRSSTYRSTVAVHDR